MTNGGLSAADTSCCDYRQKGPEVNNVRVLRHFQRPQGFSFSMYRNEAELERPSRLLAEQIVEYLTKDKMPPWPIAPESGPTPQAIYEIFPVAWSLKVVNIRRAILPALREEVIVTAHLAPKYFKAGVFPEGEWALAFLRNQSRAADEENRETRNPLYDSKSLWSICVSPELVNPTAKPGSSSLRFRPNIVCFRRKPTLDEVSAFVRSTDFGNNDICRHTSAAFLMEVDVMQVVVYPEYSQLVRVFREGAAPNVVSERKAAYGEAFMRNTSYPESFRRD